MRSSRKKYFKDGNALGRHIGMGGDPGTKLDIEIVGVVRDTKYESMRDEIPVEVYRPYHQMDFVLGMMAYVRTARAAGAGLFGDPPGGEQPGSESSGVRNEDARKADGGIADHGAPGGDAVERRSDSWRRCSPPSDCTA